MLYNNNLINKLRSVYPCICITLLLLLNLPFAQAQMFDSISASISRKPRLKGSFSSSFSFINGLKAPINSLEGAASFSRKFRIGMGFNWLSAPAYNRGNPSENPIPFYRTVYITSPNYLDTMVSRLSLKYLSYYTDYVFFTSRRWESAVKLQLGMGKAGYHPLISNSLFQKDDKVFFVYEPSISLEYHFFKWLGLGTRFGFRFMAARESWLWRYFNSPTYDLGIQIYYAELYKLLFPRTKLAQKL